ncbi:MAG: hypothetical protein CK424_01430 [Legionella sp.]|nr:MAG: hypothetical protein CK424_01430 [Legionella sp.]
MTIIAFILSQATYAADCSAPMTLDKVTFQLSAKSWVSTQTALVTTTINATLNSADVVKARAGILDKLHKMIAGEWHIVQFDRSQDSSGLDKLDVIAQVRINQSQLTNVYDTAKSLSKPGETYQITSIEFKPDIEDIQKAKMALRQILNKQVQQELQQLNQTYTEQHFTINALDYSDELNPGPLAMKPMMMATARVAPAPITVSNELIMTAMVEAGSVRK